MATIGPSNTRQLRLLLLLLLLVLLLHMRKFNLMSVRTSNAASVRSACARALELRPEVLNGGAQPVNNLHLGLPPGGVLIACARARVYVCVRVLGGGRWLM